MSRPLFGQCLGRVVELSQHDVAEILVDQVTSRRRFGEVALAWGLCQPQDVWRAWWQQLTHLSSHVNLNEIGIDAQSVLSLPKPLATRYNVIPVRSFGDQVVMAADPATAATAADELPALIQKQIKIVLADPAQVAQAIRRYYHPFLTTAALAG